MAQMHSSMSMISQSHLLEISNDNVDFVVRILTWEWNAGFKTYLSLSVFRLPVPFNSGQYIQASFPSYISWFTSSKIVILIIYTISPLKVITQTLYDTSQKLSARAIKLVTNYCNIVTISGIVATALQWQVQCSTGPLLCMAWACACPGHQSTAVLYTYIYWFHSYI